jgi:hypothetical protein
LGDRGHAACPAGFFLVVLLVTRSTWAVNRRGA